MPGYKLGSFTNMRRLADYSTQEESSSIHITQLRSLGLITANGREQV